jgi:hypothetical protein
MAELRDSILDIVNAEAGPITIRHLFYRLVGLAIIEKTERVYKTLCRHVAHWRKKGEIPWESFSDSTRWHIAEPTFDSPEDAWSRTCASYRRDLWATQPWYPEVWVEKDAIAGVIVDLTSSLGVPLFVCRGFASLSSMFSASNTFKAVQAKGKSVVIFHLGDYDPSGHAAADAIERSLEEDFDCEVNFERIAILREHITLFNLPTRPVKPGDSRSRNWGDSGCVELDSMRPADLREIVEVEITSRINKRAWVALQRTERIERETMERADIGKLLHPNGQKSRRRK